MARPLIVPPHLTLDELEQRYRRAKDPVARSHWQILWLLTGGASTATVARSTSYSVNWVREIARRYREDGPAGIGDRRHGNPGATPLLAVTQQEALRDALGRPAPDGGLWTGRWVAAWMSAVLGRAVSVHRGWEWMRRLGLRPATAPSARNPRRPDGAGGVQKGGLARAVADVTTAYPAATVTVWAEDEHRLGLLPVLRRVWAPKGHRPTAHIQRQYQWLYVYGFVRPATGQRWWCLLPTVTAEAFALALATLARDEGIATEHRAVLVVDQAGWHTSPQLVLPEGVDLVFLPSASPELQPAEHLWTLVDEPVANRAFADLDALEAVVVDRCRTLEADPQRLQAHSRFHWWPPEPPPGCPL